MENNDYIEVKIKAKRNNTRVIISFIGGCVFSVLCVLAVLLVSGNGMLNIIIGKIIAILVGGFMAWDWWEGYIWNLRGFEVMKVYKNGNFLYYKQFLTKAFTSKGHIVPNGICLYDKAIHPTMPAPRGDARVRAHGGFIIVWYNPKWFKSATKLFLFGKNITQEEAVGLVERITKFISTEDNSMTG